MLNIIILKGIPASGKSTWAKEFIKENSHTKRVNKDDLRAMLDDSKWSKHNEKFILKIRDNIVRNALKDGFNVIVDDTNLHPKHIEQMKEIAKEFGAGVKINDSFLKVDLKECIKRDLKRPNSVGEEVIKKMHKMAFPELYEVKPCKQDNKLPKAVIFDVDGTLAKMVSRNPFDWSLAHTDEPQQDIIDVLNMYKSNGYKIIICTGRDGVCELQTISWLKANQIKFDDFYIRPQGDMRKDAEIKAEMFNDIIKKYYIECVFDDRNQVVEMWRSLGVRCFQVDYGDF